MDTGGSGDAGSDSTANRRNCNRAHDPNSSLPRDAPPLPPPFYVPKSNEGDEGVYEIGYGDGRSPLTEAVATYGDHSLENLFGYRQEHNANGSAERHRDITMLTPGQAPFSAPPPNDCQIDPVLFETEPPLLFKRRKSPQDVESNRAPSVVSPEDMLWVQSGSEGDASTPQDEREDENALDTQAIVPPLNPPETSARLLYRTIHLMGRLHVLEDKYNVARSEYRDLRKQFAKRRRRVQIAQKRLFEAQLNGGDAPKPGIAVDAKIASLIERHATAHQDCQATEESLERAEKRAESIEVKVEARQVELFKLLELVMSEMAVDGDSVGAKEDSVTDSSVAPDSSSDDQPPLVREYYDAVGRVNILRERLNEFEIGHRSRISGRENAFDAMVTEASSPGFHPQGPKDVEALQVWFRTYRSFLDEYFNKRAIMARELLDARKSAEISKGRYFQETKQTPEEPDEPDALQEAIKYNLEGPIGSMYALHHEGQHLGIRPIDLVQVPFLHWQDRVHHWLRDMLIETRAVPRKNCLDPAEYAEESPSSRPRFRTFVPYYDVVVRDDRKLTQVSASATDFKPSHIVMSAEDDTRGLSSSMVPMHNVYTSRVQWTCWSGELERSRELEQPVRPHSMPDREQKKPDVDHFASWAESERPGSDWRREMLTV